jgi:oligopeptide transport system substrate-binding protein
MHRYVALFATLIAVVCTLSGCKKPSTPDGGPSSNAPHRKVLLVGNATEPQEVDPHVVEGVPENHLIIALFEGLVSSDPVTIEPVPAVAEKWEISDDGLVYTFHLRPEAKWSNGDPVTAQDFARSYQRILTPSIASKYAYALSPIVGADDYSQGKLTDFTQTGIKALDAHTLQLTLTHPTPFLIRAMVNYPWYPVPIAAIEKAGGLDRRGSAWTRPENFVGNGPFVLTEWKPNQRIVTIKSPTYWDRDKVKLDEIQFFPVESSEVEEHMFRTGQLHITYEVPLSKIATYKRDRPAALRTDPLFGVYFYELNTKAPPLDNPKVRRALALAIDRESIVRDVLHGGEQPAYGLVPPNMAGYTSAYRLSGDIAEAKRLLAEAGFPDGNGFPKLEILYNTLGKHRAVAEAIQQMWRKNLGVDITLLNKEWKVYIDSMHSKQYQIARYGWVADYADPHVFMDLWATNSGNNDSNWGNPEYDRLLSTALTTKTNDERYEIYRKMEQILVDEMPAIPIFFYTQPRLISPKVKGYFVTPLDNYPWKYADLIE